MVGKYINIFFLFLESMERNRKFLYEIREIDYSKIDEIIENIKRIDINYQIIGFMIDDDNRYTFISGFLYFKNARSIKNIKKIIGINTIKPTFENPYSICKRINEMDTFWEMGQLYNQSNYKYEIQRDISENSYNPIAVIMNQHQKLLEDTFKQKQKILEENILLRQENKQLLLEKNKQLIEENTILKQQTQNTLSIATNSNENSKTLTANSNNNLHSNNNNLTNSNNKTFNINMFLNNDCKDAITLTDFIKNIQIENEDLFYAKEHGFTEAMIRVLENGLKNYDVTERPLHCTDTKRETMHIKNESGWHKEIGSKSDDISKAIKSLSRKKMDKVSNYINNEGKSEFASKKFEENLNMMREVANGVAYPEQHIKKIVKNLVNNVKLEKG